MSYARQPLSPRFSRSQAGQPAVAVSATQTARLGEFRRRVAVGEYRLVAEPCPCGLLGVGGDVCVAEVDRYGLELDFVLCHACGTVRIDPYLDEPSLTHFYEHLYQEMYGRNTNVPNLFSYQRSHYGERIAALYADVQPTNAAALEVGCGTGGALVAFRERGWSVAGCDFSRELVEYGASQGVSALWTGTIDDAPPAVASRQFDLIFLFHVLEHVRQPAELLARLRRRLVPGGRILAVVPDLARIDVHRNPAGDARLFLHVAHTFNYSIAALQAIAAQAHCAARCVTPPAWNEASWPDARHLSELWMEFSPAEEAAPACLASARAGQAMLDYLRQTERDFQAGQCAAQQEIAARAERSSALPALRTSPPGPPRRPKWYDRLPLARAARDLWKQRRRPAA